MKACDQKGFVYLWDIQNNENTMKFKIQNDTCAMKMDINNFDEHSLALAGFDESLMVYDIRNTKKPKTYIKNAHISLITDLKVFKFF
jgi:WD40 repeat protein